MISGAAALNSWSAGFYNCESTDEERLNLAEGGSLSQRKDGGLLSSLRSSWVSQVSAVGDLGHFEKSACCHTLHQVWRAKET
ncbi:hypothetical protein ANANG_G00061700 [Anguilla anguilla]|uniref:Uncharacterized protein n=1 Tax=Anguilla anguilla TaxID=7936 RepID=A0A9D3S708_ANGAN|nr:hypothetical protein ANANG_G00061700 [Anguilla anguilla]